MSDAPHTDTMKTLAMFLIGLAVLGLIMATVYHFGIELPLQAALHVPRNMLPATT